MSLENLCESLFQREMGFNLKSKEFKKMLERKAAYFSHLNLSYNIPASARSTFAISFSPDRSLVATTHGDHTVRICDCFKLVVKQRLIGHPRTPWCVVFHPRFNHILASSCLGGEVYLWNLKNATSSDALLYTSNHTVSSLVFHPAGDILVMGSSNTIIFYDWNKRQAVKTLQTRHIEEKIRYLKFLPHGDKLITGISNTPGLKSCCYKGICNSSSSQSCSEQSPCNRPMTTLQPAKCHCKRSPLNRENHTSATNQDHHSHLQTNCRCQQPSTTAGNQDGYSGTLHTFYTRKRKCIEVSKVTKHATSTAANNPQCVSKTVNVLARFQVISNMPPTCSIGPITNNILDLSYRLQICYSDGDCLPDITDGLCTVIFPSCKLHNDSSVDISLDGTLVAGFVYSACAPLEVELRVVSLRKETFLQCIYSRRFGPNAISVSLSPLGNYAVVGLASRNFNCTFLSRNKQLIGQVLKLPTNHKALLFDELKAVLNIVLRNTGDNPRISVNTVRFHPTSGMGILCGTNQGQLEHFHISSEADAK